MINNKYQRTRYWYDNNTLKYAQRSAVLLKIQLKYFISLILPKSKILDIGSGVGQDTEYFAKKGFRSIGIDFSSGMIDYATRKRKGVEFILGDIINLKNYFSKKDFDAVWISSVFTHLHDKDTIKVLKQLGSLVKDSGILGIIVVRREQKKIMSRKDIYFNEYWKKEIEELINKGGFYIKNIKIFRKYKRKWFFIIAVKIN